MGQILSNMSCYNGERRNGCNFKNFFGERRNKSNKNKKYPMYNLSNGPLIRTENDLSYGKEFPYFIETVESPLQQDNEYKI